MSGTVAVDIAKELGIPHVQTFHSLGKLKQLVLDSEEEYNYRIRILNEERIAERCSAIIAESEVEKEQLVRYYGVKPEKIKVIHGGVNQKFQPLEKRVCRRELNMPQDALIVLYLGRITPRKGSRYFVYAIPKILEKVKEKVVFYMVGGRDKSIDAGEGFEDKERKVIDSFIRKNKIGDKIIFTGPVDNDLTPKYYSAADVVVIPSLYEPFGLVAIEAFACGLPVVATNLGGLSDTVDDGVNGFLVPPKNPKAIAEKVITLLLNPELRRKFGENGRKKINEGYRWDIIAKQMLNLYHQVEYHPPTPPPKRRTIIFATDLDGTLIDKSTPIIVGFLNRLKNLFEKYDIDFKLVYNTNRSLNLKDSSFKLINDYQIPWPDYLIAGVGTELYQFDGYFKYHRGWNQLMAKNWDINKIRSLKIHTLDGIVMDDNPQLFKVSFKVRKLGDLRIIGQISDLLIDQPVKIVFSQKRLIDIIPKNAGKGKCLEFLAKKIGVPKRNVIVFGNDATDLDMFNSGFGYNVLIGFAYKPVKLRFMEICSGKRYITKKDGAEGVIEGTLHFLPQLLGIPKISEEEIGFLFS